MVRGGGLFPCSPARWTFRPRVLFSYLVLLWVFYQVALLANKEQGLLDKFGGGRTTTDVDIDTRGGNENQEVRLQKPPQKLTMISIWETRDGADPGFLPYFFRSVEKNTGVDLVLININTEAHSSGCKTYSAAPNIRQVCLTLDEYYGLHVDFLCHRWGCSSEDKSVLLDHLKRNRKKDPNHSFFRILRPLIFTRYVDPATTLWGWCDIDEFWGNFSRVVPWDVIDQFDFIAVNNQPALVPQHLLMTKGHMTFFRHTVSTSNMLFAHPHFKSLEAYTSTKHRWDAEESYFSHFLFTNSNFTFLLVEGNTRMPGAHFLTDAGVFISQTNFKRGRYTPGMRKEVAQAVMQTELDLEPLRPTFTIEGVEIQTEILHTGLKIETWAVSPWLCFVETGKIDFGQKLYVMRREVGGPVTYRLEQRERWLKRVGDLAIDEALYMHFRVEKRRGYFKNITALPPGDGEVWVHWDQREGEVWDKKGNVLREAVETMKT